MINERIPRAGKGIVVFIEEICLPLQEQLAIFNVTADINSGEINRLSPQEAQNAQ